MDKKLKLKRNIGFTMLPFAFLFLFEPTLALNDYLPDFIGYIILCIALTNLADVNHRIADAVKGFKLGILLSFLRYVAIYLLENFFGADQLYADNETSVGTLLFVFIFAVFELIVLIPAYKNLFEGLLSLGMMHDGSYVYHKKRSERIAIEEETGKKILYVKEERNNASEKLMALTTVFLIVRGVTCVLPEFTSLIDNASYEFISLLRNFAFLLVLPLSVVWLVRIIVYFVKVKMDKPFIKNLSDFYISEISQRPNLFTARNIINAFIVMIAAFAVSFDFYTDYINAIPNTIFYVILIVAVFMLRKYSKMWIPISALSLVGIAVSKFTKDLAVTLYSNPYFSPTAVKKDLEAYLAYYKVVSFTILDVAIMLVTVALTALLIWNVYKNHSTYSLNIGSKKDSPKPFIVGVAIFIGSAILSAAGSIYYILTQPFENVGELYFDYAPIFAITLSIIFAAVAIYFSIFIINSVKARYRKDL